MLLCSRYCVHLRPRTGPESKYVHHGKYVWKEGRQAMLEAWRFLPEGVTVTCRDNAQVYHCSNSKSLVPSPEFSPLWEAFYNHSPEPFSPIPMLLVFRFLCMGISPAKLLHHVCSQCLREMWAPRGCWVQVYGEGCLLTALICSPWSTANQPTTPSPQKHGSRVGPLAQQCGLPPRLAHA